MAPRISILLPTHDRADVVGLAIASVLAQGEADFELLVVGDGCTDGTAGVVSSFADDRIRWFDLPKAFGFGYANRNLALKQARGELIGFMAHDDLLLPDHIERLVAPFRDTDVEWAYSRPLWIFDDGLMIPFAVDLRRADHFDAFMTGHNTIPASAIVHRRACLDTYGYWDETRRTSGDHELWRRMLGPAEGANLAYVDLPTTLHFQADWRSVGTFGPVELKSWARTARFDRSWPTELVVSPPAGMAPQAYLWAQVERDPWGWVAALRSSVTRAVDAMAWSSVAGMPRLESAVVEVVHELAKAGSVGEALALADAGLDMAPGSAVLLGARGRYLLDEGRVEEATVSLREAVASDPTLPYLHGHLGAALNRQGHLEEAIVALRTGLTARPDLAGRPQSAWLHAHLGRLLHRSGDLEGARTEFMAALAADPDHPSAGAALEEVLVESGRAPEEHESAP